MVRSLLANTGDAGNLGVWSLDWKILWSGKTSEGASYLENPMNGGAWRTTVPGDAVSWTQPTRTCVIGAVLCAILVGPRLLKPAVLSVSATASASEKACGEAGGKGARKRKRSWASSGLYPACRRWESWVRPVLSSFSGRESKWKKSWESWWRGCYN